VSLASAVCLYRIMNPSPTFGPFIIDDWRVASVVFTGTSATAPNYINTTIQNTGSSPWTLNTRAQVNSLTSLAVTATGDPPNGAGSLTCPSGKQIAILIMMGTTPWVSGNQYSITLLLSNGWKMTYATVAPKKKLFFYLTSSICTVSMDVVIRKI